MFMSIIHDVDGMPRAWGRAATKVAAMVTAEDQWAKRVAQRAAEGTTDRSEERGKTTTTEEAVLSLSRLKRAGGDETPRFAAMLNFNGREIAHVANGGTGGATRFVWSHPNEDRSLLFTWAIEEAKRREPTLFAEPTGEMALDFLVLDEVCLDGEIKNLNRMCRTKTLLRYWGEPAGGLREIAIAWKPGRTFDDRVSVCLNELEPRERALRVRRAEPEKAGT